MPTRTTDQITHLVQNLGPLVEQGGESILDAYDDGGVFEAEVTGSREGCGFFTDDGVFSGGSMFDSMLAVAGAVGTEQAAARACMLVLQSPDMGRREAAVRLADSLVKASGAPADLTGIGRARAVRALCLADRFGDQAAYLLEFEYPSAEAHAFLALMDWGRGAGYVSVLGAIPGPNVALVRQALEVQAAKRPEAEVLSEPTCEAALGQIAAPLARTLARANDPSDFCDDDAVALGPMLADRSRAAGVGASAAVTTSQSDIDQEVAAFISQQMALACAAIGGEAVERCVQELVGRARGDERGRGLRSGPWLMAEFVDDLAEYECGLQGNEVVLFPSIMRAWARWCAARDRLAPATAAALLHGVDQVAERFERRWAPPSLGSNKIDHDDQSTVPRWPVDDGVSPPTEIDGLVRRIVSDLALLEPSAG